MRGEVCVCVRDQVVMMSCKLHSDICDVCVCGHNNNGNGDDDGIVESVRKMFIKRPPRIVRGACVCACLASGCVRLPGFPMYTHTHIRSVLLVLLLVIVVAAYHQVYTCDTYQYV